MKYKFMINNRMNFRIGKMAKVLSITRSGYYSWLKRPKSKSQIANELVLIALNQAIERRLPRAGLIFHSDRGSQYASTTVKGHLKSIKFNKV